MFYFYFYLLFDFIILFYNLYFNIFLCLDWRVSLHLYEWNDWISTVNWITAFIPTWPSFIPVSILLRCRCCTLLIRSILSLPECEGVTTVHYSPLTRRGRRITLPLGQYGTSALSHNYGISTTGRGGMCPSFYLPVSWILAYHTSLTDRYIILFSTRKISKFCRQNNPLLTVYSSTSISHDNLGNWHYETMLNWKPQPPS